MIGVTRELMADLCVQVFLREAKDGVDQRTRPWQLTDKMAEN